MAEVIKVTKVGSRKRPEGFRWYRIDSVTWYRLRCDSKVGPVMTFMASFKTVNKPSRIHMPGLTHYVTHHPCQTRSPNYNSTTLEVFSHAEITMRRIFH